MKRLIALTAIFIALGITPAWADDGGDGDTSGTGGAFSPKLDNSPVNVVFCLQPNSCHFDKPPGGTK